MRTRVDRLFVASALSLITATTPLKTLAVQTFTDVTIPAGLTHLTTSNPEYDTGGGIAWIDIDNDGYDDLYVPNPIAGQASWLYHNVPDGNGGRRFDEIAGLPNSDAGNTAYPSTGVAVGDYDNDGCDDLFVTNGGNRVPPAGGDVRNTLLRNNFCDNGTLTFSDVTDAVRLGGSFDLKNSMVAAFGDVDGDGDLDLYVGNYVPNGDLFAAKNCEQNQLYINGAPNQIGGQAIFYGELNTIMGANDGGCTLGVALTDVDDDGKLDIYVADDFAPNSPPLPGDIAAVALNTDAIYHNLGTDSNHVPFFSRIIPNGFGDAINGMDVAVGDYDNDQDLDYYATSILSGVLNRNDGKNANGDMIFSEEAVPAGIADSTVVYAGFDHRLAGWGSAFFDMDNDGDLDLYKANGMAGLLSTLPVQPNRLFENNGIGKFLDVAVMASVDGARTSTPGCGTDPCYDQSRGVAISDYDNDGDIDIVVANTAQPIPVNGSIVPTPGVRLYRNDTISNGQNNGNAWLEIALAGTQSNKRGIGAKVRVTSTGAAGTINQMREIHAGSSHGSTHTHVVHFGFPNGSSIDSMRIEWPSGVQQALGAPPLNQIMQVPEPGPQSSNITELSELTAGVGSPLFGVNLCVLQCNKGGTNVSETLIFVGGIQAEIAFLSDTLILFRPAPNTPTGKNIPFSMATPNGFHFLQVNVNPLPPPKFTRFDNPVSSGGHGLILGNYFCKDTCPGIISNPVTETQVFIGGQPAEIAFLSEQTIVYKVPLMTGSKTLRVVAPGGVSPDAPITVQ